MAGSECHAGYTRKSCSAGGFVARVPCLVQQPGENVVADDAVALLDRDGIEELAPSGRV